ncbi:glycosyltransferase family 4 protein [Williamsia phyllosphaerae]|uniref:Glycosyltransferase WbuB n=1 Tax=Williamsia phyllosphaerae TaxID=885042 RepID=A0ABQ1UMW4_9NOCA|nr:glycosyltransferase family 4 protein [Williamsia phyllosphaerae]GGF22905.1 glycosyltransferase WbuB [Williamsia phyllosphaerae]
MRVVIIGINYFPEPTGIAVYTSDIARILVARGHDVHVLTGLPHYPQWKVSADDPSARSTVVEGVSVRRLSHPVPAVPTLRGRAWMEIVFGIRCLRVLNGTARTADAVVCVSPALLSSAMVIGRLTLRRRRPALGLWIQDVYSRAGIETGAVGTRGARLIASVESATARRADGVLAIHERFARILVSSLRVDPQRVSIIRNWCHTHRTEFASRAAARSVLGWDAAGRYIAVHAGNMGAKQDLDNLVSAARVSHGRGSPVDFVLIGDGNQRARLEGLGRDVPTLSFRDPLPGPDFQAALQAADVVLVNEAPDVREMALPSKLTSYFESGTPVVAATSADSVTAEEVAAAGAGVRVDPGQPALLADAVLEVARDAAASRRYGDNARRYVDVVLDRERAADQFESWLQSIVRDRSAAPSQDR